MDLRPPVSIVIPAKEEALTVAQVVKACLPYGREVIVIDGHSKDSTAQAAKSAGALVYQDAGKGKGQALRLGLEKAQQDIVVFLDAEGSHRPADIPSLVQPILEGRADHVQGSRALGGSEELHGTLDNFVRKVGSDVITLAINYRFGVQLTDSQNGFRAIRRRVALDLQLQEDITTIEQEMIIATLRKGYRLLEIPTHEYRREHGTSHIVLSKVAWRYAYSLVVNLWAR